LVLDQEENFQVYAVLYPGCTEGREMRTRYMTEDHKKALMQLRTRVAIKVDQDGGSISWKE
jgi:hypothetical protein